MVRTVDFSFNRERFDILMRAPLELARLSRI
ncbi:Uncharacterised protein [Burkholderia cepacia]|nr:hypothetical protein DM41_3470 [Burkholderia cepacia ATCC 25416]SPV07456.1 Uncharacterised protein [Burkholderia cepacia]